MLDHNGIEVKCCNCSKNKCLYREKEVVGGKEDICRVNFLATYGALENRIQEMELELDYTIQCDNKSKDEEKI